MPICHVCYLSNFTTSAALIEIDDRHVVATAVDVDENTGHHERLGGERDNIGTVVLVVSHDLCTSITVVTPCAELLADTD